LTGLPCKN